MEASDEEGWNWVLENCSDEGIALIKEGKEYDKDEETYAFVEEYCYADLPEDWREASDEEGLNWVLENCSEEGIELVMGGG